VDAIQEIHNDEDDQAVDEQAVDDGFSTDENNDVEESGEEESDCFSGESSDESNVEASESEEEDSADGDFVKVPVDWSPPDDFHKDGYEVGLQQVAEAVAGELGSKFPVLVAPHRPTRRLDVPSWLPVGLHKKSAPATAFLMDLVKRGDKIFRQTNKSNLSIKAGIIER
jgi:hypothetical protein